MKQILVINGSPRTNGNTVKLVERISEPLKAADCTIEVLHLSEYNIETCRGCAACVEKGVRCIKKDDFDLVIEKMYAADGYLLAAPTYMWHTTSLMKIFLDRFAFKFHRPDPELIGKPVLSVATAAGPLMKKSTAYLDEIALHLGMMPCGSVRQIASAPKAVKPQQVRQFLHRLELPQEKHRPSLRQLFNFLIQQFSATTLPKDQEYFQSFGWDKSLYYYNCRINIFNRTVISLSKGMISAVGSMLFKDAG